MDTTRTTSRGRDVAYQLHPFTNLGRHESEGQLVINRGKGVYVYDESGREYLEALAGLCARRSGSARQICSHRSSRLDVVGGQPYQGRGSRRETPHQARKGHQRLVPQRRQAATRQTGRRAESLTLTADKIYARQTVLDRDRTRREYRSSRLDIYDIARTGHDIFKPVITECVRDHRAGVAAGIVQVDTCIPERHPVA